MSLAMLAAPFDDNIESYTNNSDNNNIINKKRQAHSKTQKMYPKENFDLNKVNSILNKIHNNQDDDDDTDAFNPPPKSESVGVQKTIPSPQKEHMTNMSSENDLMFRTLGRAPQPNYEGSDNLDLNDYSNYGNKKTIEEYYKKILPNYQQQQQQQNIVNKPYHNLSTNNYSMDNNTNQDLLIQKLNYMITLLENNQDEKTNHVTEEVILYSFLGIFIIFIADAFVRVGKYVR